MLQVATGKFFRDVALHETTHRRVLFTNTRVIGRDEIVLPVARLVPSTEWTKPVSSVSVEIWEKLEAVNLAGSEEGILSTGGDSLFDDLAAVLSFAANAIFSPDVDLVRRLIPDAGNKNDPRSPSHILRKTFEPGTLLQEDQIKDLILFIERLLALNRENYELTIRAIRQVVAASTRVVDDPSLAYTMFVAALESLSSSAEAPQQTWDAFDGRKRRLIDTALTGLDDAAAGRIRDAVLLADKAGATRRFVAFVVDHISPSYYRDEAVDALRPMPAFSMEKALKRAYGIRSRNVHGLVELAPEAWTHTGQADSVDPAGEGLMLSLEGLNRLSRHVIREFVFRASTVQVGAFDYRRSLPNVIRMRLAPEMWINDATGLTAKTSAAYFEGFVELLLDKAPKEPPADGQPTDPVILPAMGSVLSRVEALLPQTKNLSAKRSMVGIYVLWNSLLPEESHPATASAFLEKYTPLLEVPSLQSFTVRIILESGPEWTTEELLEFAESRLKERAAGKAEPIAAVIEAAIAAKLAMACAAAGQTEAATAHLSRAMEELPGNRRLMDAESKFLSNGSLELDLPALLVGAPLTQSNEDLASPS
ncbi:MULTISPECIES: hypothetical protein [unclassified Arthrobacter]|uniref:hypothetical protein n=1 Tax=unclassified Arthrobacter TaxID=235627 RepID=UPI002882F8C6|nr:MULTISPECIES: hypothetical protein [unclassified Arthrobacter]